MLILFNICEKYHWCQRIQRIANQLHTVTRIIPINCNIFTISADTHGCCKIAYTDRRLRLTRKSSERSLGAAKILPGQYGIHFIIADEYWVQIFGPLHVPQHHFIDWFWKNVNKKFQNNLHHKTHRVKNFSSVVLIKMFRTKNVLYVAKCWGLRLVG